MRSGNRSVFVLPSFMALFLASLVGCSGSKHQDLEAYMNEVRARPAGEIEPIPAFTPYRPYTYSTISQRSPFERPLLALTPDGDYGRTTVAPDENRPKEFLENHNFASLTLVGSVVQDGVIWGLVDDGAGGIHRVTTGRYLGKNHGKIVSLTAARLEVIEIVPDGKGSWVERPRTLALRER